MVRCYLNRGINMVDELTAHSDAIDLEAKATRERLDQAWFHVTRLKNYVPKYLYDNLCKQFAEEIGEKDNIVPEYVKQHHDAVTIRIFATYVYPPIPDRRWDWNAHYDDEEGPNGEGSTPYMAILDLINNYNPTERFKK